MKLTGINIPPDQTGEVNPLTEVFRRVINQGREAKFRHCRSPRPRQLRQTPLKRHHPRPMHFDIAAFELDVRPARGE